MTKKRITSIVAPLVTFLLAFGFWEVMCRVNEIPKWFLPAPTDIFKYMVVNFAAESHVRRKRKRLHPVPGKPDDSL